MRNSDHFHLPFAINDLAEALGPFIETSFGLDLTFPWVLHTVVNVPKTCYRSFISLPFLHQIVPFGEVQAVGCREILVNPFHEEACPSNSLVMDQGTHEA